MPATVLDAPQPSSCGIFTNAPLSRVEEGKTRASDTNEGATPLIWEKEEEPKERGRLQDWEKWTDSRDIQDTESTKIGDLGQ